MSKGMTTRGSILAVTGLAVVLGVSSCSSPSDDDGWTWDCHYPGLAPGCLCLWMSKGQHSDTSATSKCGPELESHLTYCCSGVGTAGPYCECYVGEQQACGDGVAQATCARPTGPHPDETQ